MLSTLLATCLMPPDAIDEAVARVMAERRIQGLAFAIVHEGKTVRTGCYGLANVEHGVKVHPDTVFEVGSVTKQFTATCILRLAEAGKLSLDDSITKFLPRAPAAWKPIAIKHLLSHTSGIQNYTGLDGYEATKKLTQQQFIAKAADLKLQFDPGAKYAYSNTGYNLLGHIAANASGKPFWDYLRENVWVPVGMRRAGTRDLFDIIPNRASGYEVEDGVLKNRDSDLTDIFSAGAMTATILDMASWAAQLGRPGVLTPASWELAWTPFTLNDGAKAQYGFGFGVDEFEGEKLIGHGGSTSGFSSSIRLLPARRLSVVVLTNAGELNIGSKIALEILGLAKRGAI